MTRLIDISGLIFVIWKLKSSLSAPAKLGLGECKTLHVALFAPLIFLRSAACVAFVLVSCGEGFVNCVSDSLCQLYMENKPSWLLWWSFAGARNRVSACRCPLTWTFQHHGQRQKQRGQRSSEQCHFFAHRIIYKNEVQLREKVWYLLTLVMSANYSFGCWSRAQREGKV